MTTTTTAPTSNVCAGWCHSCFIANANKPASKFHPLVVRYDVDGRPHAFHFCADHVADGWALIERAPKHFANTRPITYKLVNDLAVGDVILAVEAKPLEAPRTVTERRTYFVKLDNKGFWPTDGRDHRIAEVRVTA